MTRIPETEPLPPVYLPRDIAKALHCSEWWVKEQARRGRIPFSKPGGSYRFTAEHFAEIMRIFESRPTESSSTAAAAAPVRRYQAAPVAEPVIRLKAGPRAGRNATSRSLTLLAGGGRAAVRIVRGAAGGCLARVAAAFAERLRAGVRVACARLRRGRRAVPAGRADLVSGAGRGWEDGRGLPVRPGLLWDASPFLTLVPGP